MGRCSDNKIKVNKCKDCNNYYECGQPGNVVVMRCPNDHKFIEKEEKKSEKNG